MPGGFIISRYTIPDRYNYTDTGFILNRIPPIIPPIIDYGIVNHITFKCERIYFYNNSTSNNFKWIFGDGTTSTKRNPFHIYKKAGNYTVKIIIDDIEYTIDNKVIVFEKSFILDAGAVYINYGEKNEKRLGVTEGGNVFGLNTEIRDMSFDGIKGSLVNSQRIIGSIPKIIANFESVDYSLFTTILPGSEISFNSGSVEIKRAIRGLLEEEHIRNIAIVAEHGSTGCYIVFKIFNAITIDSIEIPFEDSNESVIQCVFSGCFHPCDLQSEPWEIDFITVD